MSASPLDVRLVALAAAAGTLDATSFLGLDEIFPANQTGNTVLLGIAVGRGDCPAAARAGAALATFVVGVTALAVALRRRPASEGWFRETAVALTVEAALLAVLLAVWRAGSVTAAIALAAFAMGMQSLAAQRVGVAGVSTTFVTGTLTRLGARVGRGVGAAQDATPALVWVGYLAGAVAGGAVTHLWSGRAGVAVALVVVAGVAGVTWAGGGRAGGARVG